MDFIIDGSGLNINELYLLLKSGRKLLLSKDIRNRIQDNRHYLESKIDDPGAVIYGINTGFGSLCNVKISDANLEKLQENLVLSHACGMGEIVPEDICRLILLLKIINLSHGNSGVRPELVEKLIELYNADIIPVIYQMGSLGASGDLAPLAHLSLPLLGVGKVYIDDIITDSGSALAQKKISHLTLKSKEGLALLNGTQFSLAYASVIVAEAKSIFHLANKIAALSMDAFVCDISPFDRLLHEIRPHKGQLMTAKEIYGYLADSDIRNLQKLSIQDPYSFRCVPQVHGASYQAILHAEEVVNTEINSVTDNPNVFHEEDKILSGGNFHAQPLALVLDYLAIAMAELGSISERRVYQLINGDRGLPAFLTKYPGLDSGFMIAQYTAASIVSQNKQYCTPASIDSIVSSKGQEDHVSMAANAATKAYRVLQNLKSLLAIELMTAGQALEFRRPVKSSEALEDIFAALRQKIEFLEEDRLMHDDLKKSEKLINEWVVGGIV
ncbi:MAG: histidine ammonia-lyase [Saprospiraceae bacterium]|nr:histidine ammonia-lyase [Saprospiraceae bacterium]MBP6567119.1 histidine ammonia-lyase [Saprospiraceae bacterium]